MSVLSRVTTGILFFMLIIGCAAPQYSDRETQKSLHVIEELNLENPAQYFEPTHAELDLNNDGVITIDEYTTRFPERGAEIFPYFDYDKDGKIYIKDLEVLQEAFDSKYGH